jgi:4-amino-4-deoxy-L-arabinose transferase-like glycosyltransferase
VAVLIAGSMPWLPAAVTGTAGAFGVRAQRSSDAPTTQTIRLLLCWLFVPLVFFSFSGSKLPAYLLPCLPALAILIAMGWEGGGRRVRIVGAALLVLTAAALLIAGPRLLASVVGLGAHARAPLPHAVIIGLAFWVYAAVWIVRRRPAIAAFIVLLGWLAIMTGLVLYEGPLGSPRPLVRLLVENRASGEPVVEYRSFTPGLPFYLGEPITSVEVAREPTFEYASSGERRVATVDSLRALTMRSARVWVLGPRGEPDRLAHDLGLDWTPVAQWSGRSLGVLTWQGSDRARIVPRAAPR